MYTDLTRRIQIAATKEEAKAVTEALVQEYLSRNPHITIDILRTTALDYIGFLTGYMERSEANRILDLFETEHPWRDRRGNLLPFRRKPGQSRRARSFAILKLLIHSCKTREEAQVLVEEEVANLVSDGAIPISHSPSSLKRENLEPAYLPSCRSIRITRASQVFGTTMAQSAV